MIGEKNLLQRFSCVPFLSPLCDHLASVSHGLRPASYLVLEHGGPKGPDRSKDKVELIEFLGTVRRGVFWSQETLQQVAEHLDHALLSDGDDLFKPEQSTSLESTWVSHSACEIKSFKMN